MSYYFFLGETMLPVPPAKMSLKVKGKNKTINLINEGEVNVIKKEGLSEVTFDARLPNSKYPYADYDTTISDMKLSTFLGSSFTFKKADYFLERFKTLKTSKKPFRLIICRMRGATVLFNTNLLVTLEDYSIIEDAKDGFDVTCPLHFKQYRHYGTKQVNVEKDADGKETLSIDSSRDDSDMEYQKAVKIAHEKSMYEVIKGATGSGLNWKEIAELNGITNPCFNPIKGQVIRLV